MRINGRWILYTTGTRRRGNKNAYNYYIDYKETLCSFRFSSSGLGYFPLTEGTWVRIPYSEILRHFGHPLSYSFHVPLSIGIIFS